MCGRREGTQQAGVTQALFQLDMRTEKLQIPSGKGTVWVLCWKTKTRRDLPRLSRAPGDVPTQGLGATHRGSLQLLLCSGQGGFVLLLALGGTGVLGEGGQGLAPSQTQSRGAPSHPRVPTFGEVTKVSSCVKPRQRSWARNASRCSLLTLGVRAVGKVA